MPVRNVNQDRLNRNLVPALRLSFPDKKRPMHFLPIQPPEISVPRIDPVPDGTQRPFWSVMIPTYNARGYLRRTLRSVLDQDPGPERMQIQVVDDCSETDRARAISEEVGDDRVEFFQQPENVGAPTNFTTCVQRARGQWIHILHDDDKVRPGFYETFEDFIREHAEVEWVFNRCIYIDPKDHWLRIHDAPPGVDRTGVIREAARMLVERNFVLPSGMVIKRDLYEKVGGFADGLPHTTDWEMWVRAATESPLGYIHHPLALMRLHPEQDTNIRAREARNVAEIVATSRIVLGYLPEAQREEAWRGFRRTYAWWANANRIQMHRQGYHLAGVKHGLWALRLRPAVTNLLRVVKSLGLWSSSFWRRSKGK